MLQFRDPSSAGNASDPQSGIVNYGITICGLVSSVLLWSARRRIARDHWSWCGPRMTRTALLSLEFIASGIPFLAAVESSSQDPTTTAKLNAVVSWSPSKVAAVQGGVLHRIKPTSARVCDLSGSMRLQCLAGSAHSAHATTTLLPRPSTAAVTKLTNRAKELSAVLETLPAVQHAFAYGSGIFVQPGLYNADSKAKGPMLDFIFAVDCPEDWHEQNIKRNGKHYSSISWFGGNAVTCNAEKLGAGVHFNARVPWGNQVIKYGVTRKEALCRDLEQWDTLYVAGRLQKPVLTLKEDAAVSRANQKNQMAALGASLLLLPQAFTTQDLCRTIVGLSYLGDVRMGIAEDSRKVDRIAAGSAEGLREIYIPLLEVSAVQRSADLRATEADKWRQDLGAAARCHLLGSLPQTVRCRMAERVGLSAEMGVYEAEKVAEAVVSRGDHQQLLRDSLASIVGPSSRGQAIAGVFMAGATRSTWYLWEKMKKKWSK